MVALTPFLLLLIALFVDNRAIAAKKEAQNKTESSEIGKSKVLEMVKKTKKKAD